MIEIPMTLPQFEAKALKLKAEGINITSNNGTISKDGCVAQYSYDGTAKLTAKVTKAPWPFSIAHAEEKLQVYLTT